MTAALSTNTTRKEAIQRLQMLKSCYELVARRFAVRSIAPRSWQTIEERSVEKGVPATEISVDTMLQMTSALLSLDPTEHERTVEIELIGSIAKFEMPIEHITKFDSAAISIALNSFVSK